MIVHAHPPVPMGKMALADDKFVTVSRHFGGDFFL
jgi:hypothetical protein